MGKLSVAAGWLVLFLLLAPQSGAEVLRVELDRRTPVLAGKEFAARGGYELLEGRAYFGFAPDAAANQRVTDIALAPRGEDGLVHAWGELVVLQPIDPEKRSGTALVGVANRGRLLELSGLNRVPLDLNRSAAIDPEDATMFGDGFLMEQGLTLVWVGWQYDAPGGAGTLRLRVPSAVAPDGSAVRGFARSDWVVEAPTNTLALAALGHIPHLAADPADAGNTLSVRDGREAERRLVPRDAWSFSEDRTGILAKNGFEAGKIYELVYVAEAPPLVGLGFAAFRDIAAYALRDKTSAFPAKRAVAIGSSQSGRFLRHFLNEGFNRDEAGKKVYDGAIVNIAGAGRGGFNHRFSHPGRVGNPYANFFYPGDDFPFASRATSDLGGGAESTGVFDRAVNTDSLPKLFQVNTGYEYWGRAASLIHMTPDGTSDLEPLPNERVYHLASAPHYPLPFPPQAKAELEPGVFVGSPLSTTAIQRAFLIHMLRWVESGTAPPASRVPRIDNGTLVLRADLKNPVGFLNTPKNPHVAYRQFFGPRWPKGIADLQPPRRGERYAVRVPQVDELGNEMGGIQPLALRVPIATYTPWALRTGKAAAQKEMAGYVGSFIPLSRTAEVAVQRGDRRASSAELYPSAEVYRAKVEQALDAMLAEGVLLERDLASEREDALERWGWACCPE